MPGARLPGFPALPSHRIRAVLGEAEYLVRYTWRDRLASWHVDLRDADGSDLVLGRRLSPGASPWSDVRRDGMPEGVVVVGVGTDGYAREHLGGPLALVAWATADLEGLVDDPDAAVRVVL